MEMTKILRIPFNKMPILRPLNVMGGKPKHAAFPSFGEKRPQRNLKVYEQFDMITQNKPKETMKHEIHGALVDLNHSL